MEETLIVDRFGSVTDEQLAELGLMRIPKPVFDGPSREVEECLAGARRFLTIPEKAPELVHFGRKPFITVCGADVPNQKTSQIFDGVTCEACLAWVANFEAWLKQRVNAWRDVRCQEGHFGPMLIGIDASTDEAVEGGKAEPNPDLPRGGFF